MRSLLPPLASFGLLFTVAAAAAEATPPAPPPPGSASSSPASSAPAPGTSTAPSVSAGAPVPAAPASAGPGSAGPAATPEAKEPAQTPGAEPTPYDSLPDNPGLEKMEPAPAPPPRAKRMQRLELGAGLGLATRSSSSAEIDVSPGPIGAIHVRVALVDWLGFLARGSVETHQVSIAESAFGFEGLEAEQDSLRAVSLSGELEPRLRLGSQWFLQVGLGVSWNRLVAGELTASDPVEFRLDPRTGVLLDVTLSPRLSYHWTEHFGLSLWTRAALPVLQSGAVFASGPSELQTVRHDNGQLLSVGGFPDLSHGLFAQISVDVFF